MILSLLDDRHRCKDEITEEDEKIMEEIRLFYLEDPEAKFEEEENLEKIIQLFGDAMCFSG